MLIGMSAWLWGVDVRFRAENNVGMVERHVELTWEEARELHRQLGVLFQKDSQRPAEQNGRGNLRSAEK